uniref:Uncharacterized protein n=1 Tax=viral metagenome TaxID=1070528 RepID=A0A6C0KBI7_9ZZZZ
MSAHDPRLGIFGGAPAAPYPTASPGGYASPGPSPPGFGAAGGASPTRSFASPAAGPDDSLSAKIAAIDWVSLSNNKFAVGGAVAFVTMVLLFISSPSFVHNDDGTDAQTVFAIGIAVFATVVCGPMVYRRMAQ